MSVHGSIVCHDCKLAIWLGKWVRSKKGFFFKIGPENSPHNFEREDLKKAIWKFLAEHADHNTAIITEDNETGQLLIAEYAVIGSGPVDDIPISTYILNWPPKT